MEKANVGNEKLVRATKVLENTDGSTSRYEVLFKMDPATGSVTEVISEGGENGEKKIPLYYLIHLARQLYEHIGAPIPKRYAATVNFTFLRTDGSPALCVNENGCTVDINIKVAANVWLPYHEIKRFACYMHWLREIDPDKYKMAEHGDSCFKPLRAATWDLKFE